MRVPTKYIRSALNLLEEIDRTPAAKAWCHAYSAYTKNEPNRELEDAIHQMMHDAYDHGFIITDYRGVIDSRSITHEHFFSPDDAFLATLDEEAVLACIAYIYRADHFDNGTLIHCIADGLLLPYYRRLMAIADAESA